MIRPVRARSNIPMVKDAQEHAHFGPWLFNAIRFGAPSYISHTVLYRPLAVGRAIQLPARAFPRLMTSVDNAPPPPRHRHSGAGVHALAAQGACEQAAREERS